MSAAGSFVPKSRLLCHFPAARAVRPARSARNVPETKKIICPAHAAHVGHMIGLTPSTAANSFHRCGGPPPSMREVWGFAGQGLRPCRRLDIGALRSLLRPFASPLETLLFEPFKLTGAANIKNGRAMRAPTVSKPLIQPRVQGRNPARFNGGYGVPRGFKGEKSKSPPNPLGLAERRSPSPDAYVLRTPPPLFWWFRSFSAYMRWSARMRISAAAALSSG